MGAEHDGWGASAALHLGKHVADFICPGLIKSQQLELAHHPFGNCTFIAGNAGYAHKIMRESYGAIKCKVTIHRILVQALFSLSFAYIVGYVRSKCCGD